MLKKHHHYFHHFDSVRFSVVLLTIYPLHNDMKTDLQLSGRQDQISGHAAQTGGEFEAVQSMK